MTYLIVGVFIIFVGILFYMARLNSQQKKVSRQLDDLITRANHRQ